ncbi:MAG TPA: hypothetical protein VMZ22_05915 [Acidimicrobiales bacterium]|nr:hypothetical protein [Acidimicrobiales bacterium]
MAHPIERLRWAARNDGDGPRLAGLQAARALGGFVGDPAGLVTACRRLVQRQPAMGPVWWVTARMLVTADHAHVEADFIESLLIDDATAEEMAYFLDGLIPGESTILLIGPPWYSGDALTRRGDITVLAVDTPVGYGLARALERADVDAISVRDSGVGASAAAADVVLIDATAVGPDGVIAASGARAAAAVARAAGRHVVVAAGEATVLPARMWEALCACIDAEQDPWDADYELVPLSLIQTMVGPTGALDPTRAVSRADCPIAAELLRPLR